MVKSYHITMVFLINIPKYLPFFWWFHGGFSAPGGATRSTGSARSTGQWSEAKGRGFGGSWGKKHQKYVVKMWWKLSVLPNKYGYTMVKTNIWLIYGWYMISSRPGKHTKSYWSHGPVEIVDLPSYKMVIFHSYVSLAEGIWMNNYWKLLLFF